MAKSNSKGILDVKSILASANFCPVNNIVAQANRLSTRNKSLTEQGHFDADSEKMELAANQSLLKLVAPELKSVDLNADVNNKHSGGVELSLKIGNNAAVEAFLGLTPVTEEGEPIDEEDA